MTRLGLHAAAVLYTGGTVAQILRLLLDFSWLEMPFVIDWVIVILGSLAAVTLARETPRVAFRGRWERPVHYLIIVHLAVSVALHAWTIKAQTHEMYAAFPRAYSFFALAYFGFFAWRSWTIRLHVPGGTQAAA